MLRTTPALLAAALVLAACGTGRAPVPTGPTTPQIAVSEEPSAAPESSNLDTAVSFASAIYTDDYETAGSLVADNSVAARYIAHQTAARDVDELNGTSFDTDPSNIDVTPDEGSGTVTIEDRSGDDPVTYVWQDFKFNGDKITSWEVKGRASLAKRLWTTKSSDQSEGVSADLVSAYQTNANKLTVVVRLTSKSRDVRINAAAYTPDDGYKHEDTSNLLADVDKGGKAQTYFTFNKAAVGGKLKITVDRIDPDDNTSSYSLTTLNLKVR